nr:hypothetical protein [Microbacterium testaceum]
MASIVDELARGRSRAALLSYTRGRRRVPLTPGDVNGYVRSLTGGPFSAKDFRTLRGTIIAAESLAMVGATGGKNERKRAEVAAVRATAEALGNTPAVAKASYIDPRVFALYRKGRTMELGGSKDAAIRRLILGE